jgi:WD40 repeat protein
MFPEGPGGAEAHLFEVASGRLMRKFEGQRAEMNAVAFSPNGRILAVGSWNPGVQLYDVATSKRLRGINHPKDAGVGSIAFSPDGQTVASGSWDVILLSDVATGKELAQLKADMQNVNGLAFTPDGKKLVSGGQVPSVFIWDVASKKLQQTLPSHLYVGRSMALSADGKTVALGTAANTVRLWEVATGKPLFADLEGHDSYIKALAVTPDGKTLVSAGDRQLHSWDARTWAHLDQKAGWGAWSVAVSPDGQRLAWSSAWQARLHVSKLPSWEQSFQAPFPGSDYTTLAAFCNGGQNLVTLNGKTSDGKSPHKAEVVLWDSTTGRTLRHLDLPDTIPYSLAAARDSKAAFFGDYEGRVHWCDLETGGHLARAAHRHHVEALAVSPDGRLLLSASLDRQVKLWETLTGQEILTFSNHRRAVGAVAFSPDGRLAASGGGWLGYPYEVKEPPRIRVWDVGTGQEVATFSGHDSDVIGLVFLPDGTRLVTALKNNTMLVWNVAGLNLPTERPAPRTLEQLWADLLGSAPKAHAAIAVLAAAAEPAVVYLNDRLQAAPHLDPDKVKKHLAGLESGQFAVREEATRRLLALEAPALPAVRQALAAKPSLETRRRLEQVLAQLESPVVTAPETVRQVRAVAVLERVGSRQARQVLTKLAQGSGEARLTQEAKASRKRLAGAYGDKP